jgi:SAM-dependent methyltransferase
MPKKPLAILAQALAALYGIYGLFPIVVAAKLAEDPLWFQVVLGLAGLSTVACGAVGFWFAAKWYRRLANPRDARVCPWWLVHTFDNPIRRLVQRPEEILHGTVQPGEHCLDLGCGFGYFTIPLARIVGSSGTVTAADLQSEMLAGVKRRARKAGLVSRVRLCEVDDSGLHFEGAFDFVLAFWMLHEVPDQAVILGQICRALKPGGRFLLVEPKGHVKVAAFDRTIQIAQKAGLVKVREPRVAFSRAMLMTPAG